MIASLWKYNKRSLFLVVITLLLYLYFGYALDRSAFPILITVYGLLFISFLLLISWNKEHFCFLAAIALLIRLLYLPAIPNLSQDFYRFLWDGRLLVQGLNPYLTTPANYINSGILDIVPQAQLLYNGMGTLNGSHFTNYPPVNQLIFGMAAFISNSHVLGGVLVLRIITLLAEVGILYFGKKLLNRLNLPSYSIFWYLLNPFVIIEMTGNLHFESVMLCFFIWALYLLSKNQWKGSAVLIGLSISVKLIPLLFLPLFFAYFWTRGGTLRNTHFRSSYPLGIQVQKHVKNVTRLGYYYGIVGLTVLLTFAPFLSGRFISNFSSTILLWFQNFEFNASVYYIIRWIGFQTIGWNIIADVGKVLPVIVMALILILTFFRDNRTLPSLLTAMLFSISFYFLLSTTVHPWYVATPLLLCIGTRYRFPIVWSGTVMLSYAAYGADGFSENGFLLAIEYLLVIGYFLWELRSKSQPILLS